ncbi:recombinase family protein [Streptomyces niveus]|uniref:recombinase family protein n=1 Tax=Streptomyces niveus TaxID=193462 RepID=UPI0036BEB158
MGYRSKAHPDLRRAEVRQERRARTCGRFSASSASDILIVPPLDQLGRSVQNLIAIVPGLRKRGQALDMTTPCGRLVFHVLAALAEFTRELAVQGTNEGLDAVRTRGARLGRPSATTPEQASRPRPAHPPREHRDLDREAPRRLPQRHLQLRARN